MGHSVEEFQGKWAGRQILQKQELKFYNQKDELLAKNIMPIIRGERTEGKKRGKYGLSNSENIHLRKLHK